MEWYQNGVVPKWSDTQMELYLNAVVPKWSGTKMEWCRNEVVPKWRVVPNIFNKCRLWRKMGILDDDLKY